MRIPKAREALCTVRMLSISLAPLLDGALLSPIYMLSLFSNDYSGYHKNQAKEISH